MALEAVGSSPTNHPMTKAGLEPALIFTLGCSQAGKAPDFDSGISLVRVQPSQPYGPLAQSAEHLTFNQGVPRSSRGWFTKAPVIIKITGAFTFPE